MLLLLLFEELFSVVLLEVLPILAPLPVNLFPLDDELPPPLDEPPLLSGFTTSVLPPAFNVILVEDEFETAVLTASLLSLLVFTSLRVETPLKASLSTVIFSIALLPKSAVLIFVLAKALAPILVALGKSALVIFDYNQMH